MNLRRKFKTKSLLIGPRNFLILILVSDLLTEAPCSKDNGQSSTIKLSSRKKILFTGFWNVPIGQFGLFLSMPDKLKGYPVLMLRYK